VQPRSKKVLIITYYWPPAGGPGVQRVLKFVKYLPEFGWQPVILTVLNGDYPAYDHALEAEVPVGLKVYHTATWEPFRSYRRWAGQDSFEHLPTFILSSTAHESWTKRIAKWLRANLFLPDARVGWIPFARRAGLRIIRKEHIAAIYASSPPHSLQLIAYHLARRTGLKWIADFRDPWVEAFWQRELPACKWARAINRSLEKKILTHADHRCTVSPAIADLLQHKSGRTCTVLSNGYDPADFPSMERVSNPKFTIVYAGSLAKDQPLDSFLRALQQLEADVPGQTELHFYGALHQTVKQVLDETRLSSVIYCHTYLPHSELVQKIRQADLLLLIIPRTPENHGILTGKIFEYCATGNFVLGIGPQTGDAARILLATGTGRMFDYEEDLAAVLRQQFENTRRGERPMINHTALARYSRRNLSAELGNLLDQVVA